MGKENVVQVSQGSIPKRVSLVRCGTVSSPGLGETKAAAPAEGKRTSTGQLKLDGLACPCAPIARVHGSICGCGKPSGALSG